MKKLIKTFIFMLFIVLIPAKSLKAADIDIGYTGPVDPITGEPISENSEPSGIVSITGGNLYDADNKLFMYACADGYIYSSAADGMIVTGQVDLDITEGLNVFLYKDGEQMSAVPDYVYEPGTYLFAQSNDISFSEILSFTIVGKTTGELNQYVMPDGFFVKSVYLNGNEQINSYGSVDMNTEGYYEITYRCDDNKTDYVLQVMVDHTAPDITFKGLSDDNTARGPVTIEGMSETDTISVIRYGEQFNIGTDREITSSGDYRVIISDEAGNTVERSFTIMFYLNYRSWVFIGLVIAVVVGIIIALYVARKRLRVR